MMTLVSLLSSLLILTEASMFVATSLRYVQGRLGARHFAVLVTPSFKTVEHCFSTPYPTSDLALLSSSLPFL